MNSVFTPVGATVNIAAATTTANVARTSLDLREGAQVRVCNSGSVVAFVAFGDSGATATTTTSMPILPNTVEVFTVNPTQTHMAAITASGSTTLYLTTGVGQ